MNTVFEARCTSDPKPEEGKITGSMAPAVPLGKPSTGGHAVAPGAEQSAPAADEKCCGGGCGMSRTAKLEAENAALRLEVEGQTKRIEILEIERGYHVGVIADCIDQLNARPGVPHACLH